MDVTSFIESDSELEDYEDLLFPYNPCWTYHKVSGIA